MYRQTLPRIEQLTGLLYLTKEFADANQVRPVDVHFPMHGSKQALTIKSLNHSVSQY